MGSGFAKKKKESRSIQEQFEKLKGELKEKEVVGSAGNGLVEVTLNGENEMVRLRIKKECVDPEDVEALEDLIRAAHNLAVKKLSQDCMPNSLKGFNLPF